MSITDLQKQEIENLKERLDRSFSVYQKKIYKLIYFFCEKDIFITNNQIFVEDKTNKKVYQSF